MRSIDWTTTIFCPCQDSIKIVECTKRHCNLIDNWNIRKHNSIETKCDHNFVNGMGACYRLSPPSSSNPATGDYRYWLVNNSETCTPQTVVLGGFPPSITVWGVAWLFRPYHLYPDSSSGPVSCNSRLYLKCWIQNEKHLFLRRLFLTPCHDYTDWLVANFISPNVTFMITA